MTDTNTQKAQGSGAGDATTANYSVVQNDAARELASWISAALDDPASGEAFKAAATAWLDAGCPNLSQPPEARDNATLYGPDGSYPDFVWYTPTDNSSRKYIRDDLASPAPEASEVEMRSALQSALDAIGLDTLPIVRRAARIKIKAALSHPPAAEPVGLREAVEGIDDDYMTSEKHHPGYVLIPTVKFEQIVSAAKRAKEIVPSYYVNWHHDADKALATPARTDDAGVDDAGADGEMEALRSSLRNLLDACFQADGAEELPEQIDGTLLDAASDALELQYPVIWTEQQVAMLRGRQADGTMHPYTCGGDRTDLAHVWHADEAGEEAGLLFPTVRGWKCPACDYRQFWSHETGGPSALSPAPDRVEALREAVQRAHDTLIELNPNNYSHDEVCAANEAAIEAILLLAEPLGERHGKSEEWWHARRAALSTGQQKGPSQ